MTEQTPPVKKSRKKIVWWTIGVLVVLAIIGSFTDDSEDTPAAKKDTPAATSTKTAAEPVADETTKAPEKPKTPLEEFKARLKKLDDVKGEKVEPNWNGPGTYVVQFKVRDNLTKGLTRTGIGKDVFAIAEAAKKSGLKFTELSFRGVFPLVDKFGNTEDGQVFFTTFDRTTVEKINYDEILVTNFDNLENLAVEGIVELHPDLR